MSRQLADHTRYPYQPIIGRPDYEWPNGTRLAFYIGLNLEHFAFGEGLGAELAPGGPQPDVLNYAWRDYGNRVGAWRLLELLDQLDLPASAIVNASIYDHAPQLVAAHRRRGDEIVGHGWTNSERQGEMSEKDEVRLIRDCRARIECEEGVAPAGWLGPWISQSARTPDLLFEQGFSYMLDWCHDDQPTFMRTRGGRILSVPYPQELNDIPAIVARKTGASEFADMIVDQADEMLEQSAGQPLVMGLAVHAYIVGQPYRLRHLRRALRHIMQNQDRLWLTTAGAIARHALSLPEGTILEP